MQLIPNIYNKNMTQQEHKKYTSGEMLSWKKKQKTKPLF